MNKSELYEESIIYGITSIVCALFHIYPLINYYPKSEKIFFIVLAFTILWIIAFIICFITFISLRIKGEHL